MLLRTSGVVGYKPRTRKEKRPKVGIVNDVGYVRYVITCIFWSVVSSSLPRGLSIEVAVLNYEDNRVFLVESECYFPGP